MRKAFFLVVLLVVLGCSGQATVAPATPTDTATATPTSVPTPLLSLPDAIAAIFLDDWGKGDYAAMYSRLSPASRATTDAESFAQRYHDALWTATVLTVTTRILSSLQDGDQAWVAFQLKLETALAGTMITDTVMSLSRQAEQWGIDWNEGLIWPQLAGGRYFWMSYSVPVRANIYDRNGLGLAAEGTLVTIGVIPEQIQDEEAVLAALTSITDLSVEEVRDRYAAAPANWKVPIADVPSEVSVEHNEELSIPGIYRDEKPGRVYPHGSAAPHIVGWVAPVPAEQLQAYRAQGYRGDEWVGISGLEAWGEEILAGKHGAKLSIISGTGEVLLTLAERPAVAGRAIYTTIDRGFQEKVQQILGGRKGAIVVLDVRTGAIRALASAPAFDSNVFVGPAGEVGRYQILTDPRHPLVNRAIHGTYPCGSVFKIITIAAAMEDGHLDPDQTFFDCPGYWDGLGADWRKACWKADGHGHISLKDALTASCDVTFYSVGQFLDGISPEILPRYARAFGLGQTTGLLGLSDDGGLVPDPEWKVNNVGQDWWVGDSVNLSIGQGYLLVTPLQIARMMAAVANGGTLLRPYIIDHIESAADGGPDQVTQPEVVGALPVSAEHLAAIQAALLGVTTNPIGTAPHRFAGLRISVAGKTGTAESGGPETLPHSWFAAYAPADAPEIAIVVIIETSGEGSTFAAPMTRQVVEAYFGLPLTPLPPQAMEGYVAPTPGPGATQTMSPTVPVE